MCSEAKWVRVMSKGELGYYEYWIFPHTYGVYPRVWKLYSPSAYWKVQQKMSFWLIFCFLICHIPARNCHTLAETYILFSFSIVTIHHTFYIILSFLSSSIWFLTCNKITSSSQAYLFYSTVKVQSHSYYISNK